MLGLAIMCAVLAVLALALGIKIVCMRRAAKEIATGFSEKLEEDTNTLLTLSSKDSSMQRLAADINIQLQHLRKAQLRFQQGDQELKSAVSNISHDLRTPLTAICGYLDLLESTPQTETASRYLEVIKNRTQLLTELTEELFRYSVLSLPDAQIHARPVVLQSALEESIAAYYAILKEHGISPSIRLSEKKRVCIVDPHLLSRVFSNLLSNALKYSDGDLNITLTDEGIITFSNSASTLDEVQAAKLFHRFYTVESARNSTGLGLSIAKMLVEQMNGTLTAHYKNGRLDMVLLLEQYRENPSPK